MCIKIEKKMGEENLIKELAVYPYILFGGNFKSRLKNKEKYMKITSNRYVRMKTEEESLEKYVRTIIQNNPIYGFECFVKMKDEYQIEEESEGWKQAIHQDHYFLINFETDSSNEDYFITNIQDIAKWWFNINHVYLVCFGAKYMNPIIYSYIEKCPLSAKALTTSSQKKKKLTSFSPFFLSFLFCLCFFIITLNQLITVNVKDHCPLSFLKMRTSLQNICIPKNYWSRRQCWIREKERKKRII